MIVFSIFEEQSSGHWKKFGEEEVVGQETKVINHQEHQGVLCLHILLVEDSLPRSN